MAAPDPARPFLPAALEVQETPPSPLGRALLWLLLALFATAIAWACLGRVDIVVTATGRVVPTGQVKQVQAPELGTVAALLVGEGDVVAAGQALLRLDPAYVEADRVQLREQLNDIAVQATWRGALEKWLADGAPRAAPDKLPPRFAAVDQVKADTLYRQHRLEISASLEVLARELAANRAERATLQAERDGVRATLQVLAQRVAAYKTLVDQRYGARVQYLEMLQQQTELEKRLPVLRSRQAALAEAAAAISARIQADLGDIRKGNLLTLAQLDSERSRLQQDANKVARRQQQLQVNAPVAGTVQELAVHTVGAVVSPAQELMKIVPAGVGVEVEALLHNRDVGFVNEGQRAVVKVDTFNFTQYGLLAARVLDISNDAVEDPSLGWVFRIRLLLDKDWLAVEGKQVRLSPGMAVTAEVRTGQRRLIEFFLSPLLRYQQESVRER
ncbi:MAG: HlyD family type I secretion periplasmic adaptor subunit [Pseudomonadales bacterium]|nr:HlyD family type I secretion periplasmic adaptor subunit [Pseudomonadales bacterium]